MGQLGGGEGPGAGGGAENGLGDEKDTRGEEAHRRQEPRRPPHRLDAGRRCREGREAAREDLGAGSWGIAQQRRLKKKLSKLGLGEEGVGMVVDGLNATRTCTEDVGFYSLFDTIFDTILTIFI